MRIIVALATLALLAGCGEDEPAAAPTPGAAALAELTVTVDADGNGGTKPRTADVRCETQGDSQTCRAVADMTAETFAPTRGDVACTQQYGGPETATVAGTLRREPIDARFSRENGCEISRWKAVEPLLAAAG
jgi:hypothetical protein